MPTAKETGTNRTPIEIGNHPAVCYAVIDLGTQPPMEGSRFQKVAQRKVMITWEFPEERVTIEREGVPMDLPRALSQEFTLSLHEKSALRKTLESWRGRAFSADELKGFDLKNLLGVNCMVNVIHKENGYEKITAVTPLPKGLAKRSPENELCLYDIGPGELPRGIPDWVKRKIDCAEERTSGYGAEPAPRDEDGYGTAQSDDIPF